MADAGTRELSVPNDTRHTHDREDIWLLGSLQHSYGLSQTTRKDDEDAINRAKVFIDDSINYRSIHHATDALALKLYKIHYSKVWQWLYTIVLSVLLLLAFVEYPSSLTLTSDSRVIRPQTDPPCGVTESVELICLIVFLIDFTLKCRVFGIKRSLRRPWMWAYVICTLFSFVDVMVSYGLCPDYSEYPYRVRRLLRPVFLLQASSLMKKMTNALKKTLREILGVLFFLAMHVYLFTIIGMLIFQTQCLPIANLSNQTDSSYQFGNEFHNTTSNPEGEKYFTTFWIALVNMIVLLTTANHPDIMIPAYNESRFYSIFFILFILSGLYVLMNIMMAVVYNRFRGFLATSVQSSFNRHRVAQFAAFVVLANRTRDQQRLTGAQLGSDKSYVRLLLQEANVKKSHASLMSERLETIDSDLITWKEFRRVFSILQETPRNEKKKKGFRSSRYRTVAWMQFIMKHRYTNYVSLFVSLSNCLIITLELIYRCSTSEIPSTRYALGLLNLLFVIYYCLEVAVNVILLRRYYFSMWRNIFDIILTALILFVTIAYGFVEGEFDGSIRFRKRTTEDYNTSSGKASHILIVVIDILILLRLLRIIPHIKILRQIASTIIHLFANLRAYFGLMVCIYYFFAILGMMIFKDVKFSPSDHESQKCGTYQHEEYFANNFGDFAASLVVLYDVMVVNNWFIILNAFSERVPGWAQLYFILWWLMSTVIGISLLVALLLEAFITKWEATVTIKKERENLNLYSSSTVYEDEDDPMDEDIVDTLKRDLKEPEDEELISELLSHGELKLQY